MHFELSRAQLAMRDRAREFAQKRVATEALRRDRSKEFPTDLLQQMGAEGLMGINIPERFGGLQAGVVAYSLAVTEVAAVDPAVAVTMCVNNMVAEVIEAFGTPRQKDRWIPEITAGSFPGSFCLSEPAVGSDAQGLRTRIEEDGNGYRITGQKAWITSGTYAGVYLVWGQEDVEGDTSISCFLVDSSRPGIARGAPEKKMGQHASDTITLAFDEVRVHEDDRLGDRGRGFRVAMMALDGGRIGIASQALGIVRATLTLSRRYASELLPSDLETLDELEARFEAARSITWTAAARKEAKIAFTKEASMAKLMASELASDAARRCVQMIEKAGLDDPMLNKLVCDARVTRIYEGTSEIQRIVIAREVIREAI